MTDELLKLEQRLDWVAAKLLPPLRTWKILEGERVADLLDVADKIRTELEGAELVPRRLTGKLWDIFTTILMQAEYAQNSEQIMDVAWLYHERLQDMFGATVIWDGAVIPGEEDT